MNGPNHNIREPRALFPPGHKLTYKPAYTINSISRQKLQVILITEHQSRLQGMWICPESDTLALKKKVLARNKEALKNAGILQGSLVFLPAACKNA